MLRRVMVVLVGVLVSAVLGSAPALGTPAFPFDGQIAPAGGSFGGVKQNSVAVSGFNQETYVADFRTGVVDVFSSAGTQLASWDGSAAINPPGTPAGSLGEVAVAANDGTGRVYVLDPNHNVVDVFDASGSYVCQITGSASPSASECNGVAGSATPAGGLSEPGAVAVDQATGEVYVLDASHEAIVVFSSGGAYLRQISLASIEGGVNPGYRSGIAVSDFNGHVYLAYGGGAHAVYEFGVSGELLATSTGANTPAGSFGQEVSVAADDTSGDVYVTDSIHTVVDVFNAGGEYLAGFGHASLHEPRGVAVDQATGKVYVSEDGSPAVVGVFGPPRVVPDVTTGSASEVRPASATLRGTVNPDGIQVSDCRFEYGTDTFYGQSAPCVPAAGSIPADSSVHAVTADLTGLQSGTTYHFRLDASNANGVNEGGDVTFTTLPRPSIDHVSAANVTGASADLSAAIDPNGYDTTYHFEWGTSTAYGTSVPVPDVDIGAGTSAVPVATHLSGLTTNTTYHWRVLATSTNGTTATGDHTFVYSTTGVALPDNRQYEMVTPPQKNGALIGKGYSVYPDVSQDGSRVVISSVQCFGGAGSCTANRGLNGEPFAFTRTDSGWVTVPLAPPATELGANTPELVSADAGTALFHIQTSPAGGDDWYARQSDGRFLDVGPVTAPSLGAVNHVFGSEFAASADLSHVVWSMPADALSVLWPFDATTVGPQNSLYEYAGVGNAAPALVGVSGGAGSTDLIGVCGTKTSLDPGSMSAEGRVVFFAVEACASGSGVNAGVPVPAQEMFARIDGSRSVLLSGRSPAGCTSAACLGSPAGDAKFDGASADGSKAFFTSTQQLTDSASEDSQRGDSAYGGPGCANAIGVNGCNLYEYDFANPAGHSLITVSAGDTSGGGPRVQGVAAVSSDGSHVYFVARGVLTNVANGAGGVARNGAENLYVFERDAAHPEGRVAFIATLPESDSENWTRPYPLANVTPDGRFLVFTSNGALTADDTSVSGAAQVYRYDARTSELVRVSIGDRGFNDNGNGSIVTHCLSEGSPCSEDATIVEPQIQRAGVARMDPTMSDDGSYVFFRSPVALVPGALDEVRVGEDQGGLPGYAQNVYEYHDGRVFLISDGRDTGQSTSSLDPHVSNVRLLGSDATGANVFFATSDQLVGSDTDTELDFYDARVCTASDPCVPSSPPPASCDGEACHGAAGLAPPPPAGATVTFSGPGNLAAPLAVHKKAVIKKHVRHRRRPRRHGRRRAKSHGAVYRGGRGSGGGRS